MCLYKCNSTTVVGWVMYFSLLHAIMIYNLLYFMHLIPLFYFFAVWQSRYFHSSHFTVHAKKWKLNPYSIPVGGWLVATVILASISIVMFKASLLVFDILASATRLGDK